MRVTVTGAWGNLGQPVVEELIRRGHQVRAFDLDTRANRKAAHRLCDLEPVWGDLRSPADVERAVAGQEAVIHLAFVLPKLSATGVSSEERPTWAREVNVGGTRNLLNAMRAQPASPRILFTSSLHVYGQTQDQRPYRQVEDPLRPTDHYSQHKILCETLVRRSGLCWAIFRLGASMPTRLILDRGMFDVPLDTRIEFVHQRDVALAIANALDSAEVWGHIWNIGGGPRCQLTERQMIEQVLEAVGVGMLPDDLFTEQPFPVDWLDTSESQRVLRFQNHTLQDYIHDVTDKLGYRRYFVRLFRPLIRLWLVRQAHAVRA